MSEEERVVIAQPGLDIEGIFRFVYDFVTGIGGSREGIAASFLTFWQIYSLVAFAFSALLLFGIIYAKLRLHELEEVVEHELHAQEHQYAHTAETASKNSRWEQAVTHIESDNPNDWRLAVIEADIILEELLDKLGYAGISIGDKLKHASPQFFKTIEDAWKAHKVRNDIAHRGSDFILTKRLAKETLEQYRRVFEEHNVI